MPTRGNAVQYRNESALMGIKEFLEMDRSAKRLP